MAYTKGSRILGYTRRYLPFVLVFAVVITVVRLWDWCAFGLRVHGRRHVRNAPRAVLVSNHTLLFDPGVIAHAIRPRRTYFTMLEETALIPYLGTFVRLLGGVPIPEGAGSLRALDGAARSALDELGLIHFFPEGECYDGNQDLVPFHAGAFVLALRLRVPVIPVTTVLHERRFRGKTTVRVGGRDVHLPPRVEVVIGAPRSGPVQRGAGLRADAAAWAEETRREMQEEIDRRHGSRALFRGQMPRLVKKAPSAA